MPEYRYIGVDLLTRQIIEDLPLYGVSLTRRISGSGNMTGSYKLGTGLFSDPDLLSASEPGLRALFVVRNNTCIWAGPIWTRTYQSQAQVISLTGQTFESIFAQIAVDNAMNFPSADQALLFKYLIDQMQLQPSCNFGLDTSSIAYTGVMQELIINSYEHKVFSEPISDLVKAAGSFDWMIDPTIDANDNITLPVKVGFPFLGYGLPGIELDYPGPISDYYWPESAAKGVVRETIMGKGEGTSMPVGTYTNQDLLDAGYPRWEDPKSEKSIDDPTQISRIAQESGLTRKIPVVVPTFDVTIDESVDFNEWSNLGAPINVHIQDVRFPDGKDFSSRMLGWDFTPSSSDNVESVKLVLEGQS